MNGETMFKLNLINIEGGNSAVTVKPGYITRNSIPANLTNYSQCLL